MRPLGPEPGGGGRINLFKNMIFGLFLSLCSGLLLRLPLLPRQAAAWWGTYAAP